MGTYANVARMRLLALGCAVAMLLSICLGSACGTTKNAQAIGKEGIELTLTPVRLTGVSVSNVPAGQYVFRKSKDWRAFCSKHGLKPIPRIDFQNASLLTVFLGQRPNTGYTVEIVAAREYEQAVVVKAIEHSPAPGMMYAQVITYPYQAVLIPKIHRKGVRFEKSLEVGGPQRLEKWNTDDKDSDKWNK
ncbi:protease complex subunit PrcB family protein [Candidatus Poribacteria bacterium]|nr:protease complex subunit PrcB family protein [Candidatus Poribacteria bacterium]